VNEYNFYNLPFAPRKLNFTSVSIYLMAVLFCMTIYVYNLEALNNSFTCFNCTSTHGVSVIVFLNFLWGKKTIGTKKSEPL
jgi:hypothetical protein